jgi:signal transduction histidine kinase
VVNPDLLRCFPMFASLPPDDLDELCQAGEVRSVAPGEVIIEEGTTGDTFYVILDGELEITKQSGGREVLLAVRRRGEFVGERSLLDDTPRSASVRALRDSQLFVVHRAAFEALLASSPTARSAVLRTMTTRLQSTESMLMHHQNLAALGTMAAGLAHELNNPAAAIRRSAAHLGEVLGRTQRLTSALATLRLEQHQAARLDTMLVDVASQPPQADPTEEEDVIEAWLDDHAVPEAWMLAPELAAAGWTPELLDRLAHGLTGAQVSVALQWLGWSAAAQGLLAELRTSAEAISDLVQAVKVHTHLGEAPIQEVDVRESLETTLVVLRHKLKDGIRVIRDYAADVPPVEAYGSELNQVWSNIVDNAIDAMQGHGTLRIRVARAEGEQVVVEIGDDGPGIPPEVQARLFEPFFTTKAPGMGTGLGLHVTYTIVVARHRGEIHVDSQPGATTFRVCLPIALPAGAATLEAEI